MAAVQANTPVDIKTRQTSQNNPYEHRCKIPQQNTNKLKPATYKKDYAP